MTLPPHDLERLWKVPIDPCNVQLGMAGCAIVLAVQPLPWWASSLAIGLLVAGGLYWALVYEKEPHGSRPAMDDPRTGVEYDNFRDVLIGVGLVVSIVLLRGAYTICD